MLARPKEVIILFLVFTLIWTWTSPVSANVIEEFWVDEIETYLLQVDIDTTAEIVVYVVQSLSGHGIKDSEGHEISEIVQLGVYIFNELSLPTPNGPVVGIGKTGEDNGVLVLVAMEEREWRIEVGYGLEGDITDIEANLVAEQFLIPNFQEGEYGLGLYHTVVALSEMIPVPSQVENLPIRGRYFYENINLPAQEPIPLWVVILIIFIAAGAIVAVIVLAILVKKGKIKLERSRSTGWGRRGGSGGWRPSGGGPKGGGGRSGGGGAKGKW